jgi:hypothetical protein
MPRSSTHRIRRRDFARQTGEGLRLIQAEGQGVFRFAFFTPADIPTLAAAAAGGDTVAAAQMRVIVQMLAAINACQDPTLAPCCLLCGTPIWRGHCPAQVGVMHAACDHPAQATGHVICSDCDRRYPTAESFNAAVLAFYRENLMSDARVLPPFSAPGRA